MRVGWAYDPFCLRHDTGPSHPERPERLEVLARALAEAGLPGQMQALRVEPASVAALESVHEPAYVALVQLACEQGMNFLGASDTHICGESFEVARAAVGSVLAACDAVMAGRVDRAFCAVRPPGHHAEPDRAGGYCLFNNVAIGAEYLLKRHQLPRVAIVDWDVHHGNGTQRIFESRSDVLYISLHEAPGRLYPHTGYANERGTGAGEGFTLNIPMRPGSGDAEYRRAFAEQVVPALDAYGPACILISAGFDATTADGTADINLAPESFAWMTREMAAVANRVCGGRVIAVLEGGYEVGSLCRCVVQHITSLLHA
jgi:acetoin utilization deacetylase AcuC-like enzyme